MFYGGVWNAAWVIEICEKFCVHFMDTALSIRHLEWGCIRTWKEERNVLWHNGKLDNTDVRGTLGVFWSPVNIARTTIVVITCTFKPVVFQNRSTLFSSCMLFVCLIYTKQFMKRQCKPTSLISWSSLSPQQQLSWERSCPSRTFLACPSGNTNTKKNSSKT